MTARSSPQHAATVRAQVKRRGDVHWKRAQLLKAAAKERQRIERETELFGGPVDWQAMIGGWDTHYRDAGIYFRGAAGNRLPRGLKSLVDEQKTEEQKASRWARIWGAKS